MIYSKIACFDVESNGLHGQAFAVGGLVLYTQSLNIEDQFYFRCPIDGKINQWVADNVLPVLPSQTHQYAHEMRADFWKWLMCNKTDTLVMADVAYPVEARFLAACQDDDPSREWEAPYPLYDVSSLLLAAGFDPDVNRQELAKQTAGSLLAGGMFAQHNPLDDAYASAVCAWAALTAIPQNK